MSGMFYLFSSCPPKHLCSSGTCSRALAVWCTFLMSKLSKQSVGSYFGLALWFNIMVRLYKDMQINSKAYGETIFSINGLKQIVGE